MLVVGDSLSAEYGIARGTGWVALMANRMRQQNLQISVINASISGDTTAGGISRFKALLNIHQPTHVLIELGGNDALRGLDLSNTEKNINAMIQMARLSQSKVMLLGMQLPPNYGKQYSKDFFELFQRVSKNQNVPLVPFLLQGIADHPKANDLFQPDLIHPNAKAQPIILDNVWPTMISFL